MGHSLTFLIALIAGVVGNRLTGEFTPALLAFLILATIGTVLTWLLNCPGRGVSRARGGGVVPEMEAVAAPRASAASLSEAEIGQLISEVSSDAADRTSGTTEALPSPEKVPAYPQGNTVDRKGGRLVMAAAGAAGIGIVTIDLLPLALILAAVVVIVLAVIVVVALRPGRRS
jgi:hypothetical protein